MQNSRAKQIRRSAGGNDNHLVHFFAGGDLEQLAGDLLLDTQQYSVGSQNADANTRVANRLNGVLHLVEAPFGRESRSPRIVAPSLQKG